MKRPFMALMLVAVAGVLFSCGGSKVKEAQTKALTAEEIAVLVKAREEAAQRILGAHVKAAQPIIDLDRYEAAEKPQAESSPYPGREEATERLEELDILELIKRFGVAYYRTNRVIKRGRPYDWAKLEHGKSPARQLSDVSGAMLIREHRDGYRRGKEFAKNLVLLRRNARRVWRDAVLNAGDYLERDFKRLGKDCGYFPGEIAEALMGAGARIAEEELVEKPPEAPEAPTGEAKAPEGGENQGGTPAAPVVAP